MTPDIRITLLYVAVALLWIITSDTIVAILSAGRTELLHIFSTLKGGLYVLLTGGLLLVVLRREFNHRRQIEQNLIERERDFRNLFRNHPQPMWVIDQYTLRFVEVNEAAVAHYGYTRAEFLKMSLVDIRPPEDVPRLLEHVPHTKPELQQHSVWRHRYKDGTVIDVEIISHTLEFNGTPAVLVVAENVTARRAAEKALHEQQERLNSILESIDDVVWSAELVPEYHVAYLSSAAERLYGIPLDILLTNPTRVLDVIHPDDHTSVANNQIKVFETGAGDVEYRIIRPDGAQRWVRDRTRVTVDANGTPVRWDGTLTDITSHKEHEAEQLERERLQTALHKEIELNNLRRRFMSMISHQFRNPLTTISTSAGILEAYASRMTPEQSQRHFAMIQIQVAHLVNLLDDLLKLLTAETIGPDFHPQQLNLTSLVKEQVEQTRQNTQGAYEIDLHGTEREILLNADARLIGQALENLLTNATKYSPRGSTIRVELDRTEQTVILHVRDQGIGIPPEDQTRLFEAFYRGSNVANVEGTGLGLAITKQAIELHGGSINLESQPGRGSTFTITLPSV